MCPCCQNGALVSSGFPDTDQLALFPLLPRAPRPEFETILLVGAGIGVTPYASILKSIWYRMSEASDQKRTRLSKVYFVHICRDTESISWFRSVLAAIEAKDTNGVRLSLPEAADCDARDVCCVSYPTAR